MNNKYLASVDMDATFIRDDLSISELTKNYISSFVEKGNHFIINTGRPHQGAVCFLKELGIHEPISVNNGTALVWYNDDYSSVSKYVTFHMNIDILKSFIIETKHTFHSIFITSIFDEYSNDFDLLPFFVKHPSEMIKKHVGNIEEILNTEPIKCEIRVKVEHKNEFLSILSKKIYQDEFEYIYWGDYDGVSSFEFSKKGVNKGYAMNYLLNLYGIPKENSFSFGDQLNDLSMIKEAQYGVAMINSRDDVIKEAKYVSSYDNNNDGVIMFIKETIKE